MDSAECKRLDARTQYTRRRILESMLDESIKPASKETFADFALDRITPKALRVLRDRKVDLPGAADNRVQALRRVFKWAVKHEHMSANPAACCRISEPELGWMAQLDVR
jgi:hypothetical protein